LRIVARKIKTVLNQDAPVAIAKGNATKELVLSWMIYAPYQLLVKKKELKTRITSDRNFFVENLL
jgi:hypothetical protein